MLRSVCGIEDILRFALSMVGEVLHVKNIGVRIEDARGRYPFIRSIGHHELHAQSDCADDLIGTRQDGELRCLCGRVLQGKADEFPKNHTECGSYIRTEITTSHQVELTTLLATDSAVDPRCDEYASLALIPLRNELTTEGLLHIADKRALRFSRSEIDRAEKLAKHAIGLCKHVEEVVEKEKRKAWHILVVDDEPGIRRSLSRILTKFGYKISTAEDGQDAWEQMQSTRIEAIVLDLKMPRMGGLELAKKVRERFGVYGPRIIIHSSNAESITAEVVSNLKIDHVLDKTGDPFALNEAIVGVLN